MSEQSANTRGDIDPELRALLAAKIGALAADAADLLLALQRAAAGDGSWRALDGLRAALWPLQKDIDAVWGLAMPSHDCPYHHCNPDNPCGFLADLLGTAASVETAAATVQALDHRTYETWTGAFAALPDPDRLYMVDHGAFPDDPDIDPDDIPF